MNHVSTINQSQGSGTDRPLAITLICLLGFIGAALSIPMVLSDIAKQIGNWFPPYSGLIAISSLVCMIGLWFTKKWAMYAYIGLVVINQLVLVIMGQWMILPLIIHLIIVITILVSLDVYSKSLSHQLLRYLRRQLWAIIVAYMIGIHNFYKGEIKSPDDIVITIEDIEEQEDDEPKD